MYVDYVRSITTVKIYLKFIHISFKENLQIQQSQIFWIYFLEKVTQDNCYEWP